MKNIRKISRLKNFRGGGTHFLVSRSRRLWLSLIAFLFSTVLVFCAFFVPFNGDKKASAYFVNESPASIGSVTFSDYADKETVFDATVLKKLYGKILGRTTASYQDLAAAISGGYKNYGQFGDIVLEFGGYKWAVTYVTESNNGNIAATLILSENIPLEPYEWNTYNSGSAADYPANMYSSSKIRVQTLNAGGDDGAFAYNSSGDGSSKYAISYNTLTTVSRNDRVNNRWSAFTLSDEVVGKKSLTDYILQPKFIDYQSDENVLNIYNALNGTSTDEGGNLSPNEAYGIPAPNNSIAGPARWYISTDGTNLNYGGDTSTGQTTNTKTGYSDWQYDYLWLASTSEIGTPNFGSISNKAVNGIWGINSGRDEHTRIRAASDHYWLRSGGIGNVENAIYIRGSSGSDTHDSGDATPTNVTVTCKLRPCLHLNLTASESASKVKAPTADTTEFAYDGGTKTYTPEGFDSNVMNISGNTAVDVGKTTVSVSLKSGYVWSDGATEADGVTPKIYTFDFEIGKGTPIVNPKYDPVNKRYPALGLPTLTNTGTAGTFTWKEGQTPTVGTNNYAYVFTPTDTDKWKTYDGTISITYVQPTVKSLSISVKSGSKIYDVFTAEELNDYLTVVATYDDNTTHTLISSEFTVTITTNNGKLTADGTNEIYVEETISSSNNVGDSFSIPSVEASKIDSFVLVKLSATSFTYPVTADDIKDALSQVKVKWNYNPSTAVDLTDYDMLEVVGTLDAGNQSLKLKCGDVESSAFSVTIAKGDFDIKATLDGDTVAYDGNSHGLEVVWQEEIDGVTAEYLYVGDGYSDSAAPVNAGEYTVTVSFTHENPNYNAVTATLTATLTIEQADYPDADKITFADATKTYGGQHSIVAENVPSGVKVVYVYDGNEQETPFVFSDLSESGYEVEAKFVFVDATDAINYKAIPSKTAKLIITNKTLYLKDDLTVSGDGVTVDGNQLSATFNGEEFTLSAVGKVKDKDGAEVTSSYTAEIKVTKNGAEVSEIKDAGSYEITVAYTMPAEGAYADYEQSFEIKYTLTVEKADFVPEDNGIVFNNKSVPYDGQAHSIELEGELPEWITVSYDGNGQTEAGTYTITAKFSHSNPNYNAVADVTATLTIGAGVYVPEFTFVDKTSEYNGKSQTISLTGEVPEWLTVEFYLNGEEFVGVTEIGEYEITAKFTHGNSAYGPVTDMTAKLIIVKAKISAPKFTGTYSYTGTGIIVKSSDFESFDSAVLKLETSKGTGAGEYKAQFTLLDTEHYEWAEEGAGETVWNIDKAKITATKTSGRLPEYSSETYKGEFGQIVNYKYYTDETCSEEVHPDDLEENKEYFVKAVLTDGDNFEIDENAVTYFELGFKHSIGEAEQKSNFFKDNWMWLAIGAGALLLLLILILALTRRRAHADGYDDYDYADDEDEDDEEDYDDEYDDYEDDDY